MNQRIFRISAWEPIEPISRFMAACDLGIAGVYRRVDMQMTAKLASDVTDEQLARQPGVIREAFEQAGYLQVFVSVDMQAF